MENLLFAWSDIRVETLTVTAELITLSLASTRSEAACPLCQEVSRTIHSRYERSLGDLPCCGKALRLRLQVRRFFCHQAACPRRVFAERRSDIMQPFARRTIRLNETLQTIGLALGGEAGQRTARQLAMAVSAATLLRRVRALPAPPTPSVRVVGIDDFALRRGHRYGTILVDEEQHKPVDLLPDRETATVQAWLEKHPEIEIITRDRAVAYANAARAGAPQATQVADRFHLLQNLTEAVQGIVTRQHCVLREVAQQVPVAAMTTPAEQSAARSSAVPPLASPVETKAAQRKQARQAWRESRFQAVKDLRQQGLAVREIARRTKLQRVTIRKYLSLDSLPEPATRGWRGSKADCFRPYMQQRWEAGCRNVSQLFTELQEQGYCGSCDTLRRQVRGWREATDAHEAEKTKAIFPVPSPRQATWWLLQATEKLTAEEAAYVQMLVQIQPEFAQTQTLAQEFQRLVQQRAEKDFDAWRQQVRESGVPEFASFAASLMTDEAAVRQALKSEWSNGQTEGQINRLKMLKRQMYGRANLDLLRLRVLYAP